MCTCTQLDICSNYKVLGTPVAQDGISHRALKIHKKITKLLHYQLNDTLFEIELFPSIVLSSRVTNWQNDIHKFLQQFEWLRVNRDSNSHLKVLRTKQTQEWQFTH